MSIACTFLQRSAPLTGLIVSTAAGKLELAKLRVRESASSLLQKHMQLSVTSMSATEAFQITPGGSCLGSNFLGFCIVPPPAADAAPAVVPAEDDEEPSVVWAVVSMVVR